MFEVTRIGPFNMKIAITGGAGFFGRHLAHSLVKDGHQAVLVARGVDSPDADIRGLDHTNFAAVGTSSVKKLTEDFAGCDAVAHCAGINRAIGEQTYERVHVHGTQNVVDAAIATGLKKVLLLSFLRARPHCGSPHHDYGRLKGKQLMPPSNSSCDFPFDSHNK